MSLKLKQNLRYTLKEARRRFVESLDPARQADLAQGIAAHFFQLIPPHQLGPSDIVAAYWPMPQEVDPRPLMKRLVAHGGALALPRVTSGKKIMTFHRWAFEDPLERGPFKTQEPLPQAEKVTPTLILVPLVGFDEARNRLGQGEGHYDATLKDLEARRSIHPFRTIGLAWECQKIPKIPQEPHDHPLDCVITEERIYQNA